MGWGLEKSRSVGPAKRGLAMGLNEAAGYGAVAATALATGYIAEHAGLRPEPFLLGIAYVALGVGLSAILVKETHAHAQLESTRIAATAQIKAAFPQARIIMVTEFTNDGLREAARKAGARDYVLKEDLSPLGPLMSEPLNEP